MNTSRFFIALGVILCLVLSSVIARTGRCIYSFSQGPEAPMLKWSFNTNGAARSSPVIGADGTVYVGSDNYGIYAIDADGNERWTYEVNAIYMP